jgi:hypothetical protein
LDVSKDDVRRVINSLRTIDYTPQLDWATLPDLPDTENRFSGIGRLSDDALKYYEAHAVFAAQIWTAMRMTGGDRYIAITVALSNFYTRVSNRSVVGSLGGVFLKYVDSFCEAIKEAQDELEEETELQKFDKPSGVPVWEPPQYEDWSPQIDFEGVGDYLRNTRNVFNTWELFANSRLWKKLKQMVAYATMYGLHGEISDDIAKKLVKEHRLKTTKHEMVYQVLEFALFLCERGYQFVATGEFSSFYHSSSTYEKWYTETRDVISKARYLNNPAAHGIDEHMFREKVDVLLEQGNQIIRFARKSKGSDAVMVQRTMYELATVKAEFINRKSAQALRKAPFTVLVEGQSKVAKSTFAKLIHDYYAAICHKDNSEGHRYTRECCEDYWDGFVTPMWSVLMDDIAYILPDKSIGVDKTLVDILSVGNNTPKVPNMAALEDKGRTPLKPDLLVGTTNCPDLNLSLYFQTPYAVARRFPFHIRIRPKAGFEDRDNPISIQSNPPAATAGCYEDWWDICIYVPKAVPQTEASVDEFRMMSKLEPLESENGKPKIWGMREFLPWLHSEIVKHNDIQNKIMASNILRTKIGICDECHLPEGMCSCEESDLLFAARTEEMEPQNTTEVAALTAATLGCVLAGLRFVTRKAIRESRDAVKDVVSIATSGMEASMRSVVATTATTMKDSLSETATLATHNALHEASEMLLGRPYKAVKRDITTKKVRAVLRMRKLGQLVVDTVIKVPQYVQNLIIGIAAISGLVFIYRKFQPSSGEIVDKCVRSVQDACSCLKRRWWASKPKDVQAYCCYDSTMIHRPCECRCKACMEGLCEPQGGVLSSALGERPTVTNERESVWYNGDYTVSSFDMSRQSLSWKALDQEQVRTKLRSHVAVLFLHCSDGTKRGTAFAIGGQHFITTAHRTDFLKGDSFTGKLQFDAGVGVSRAVGFSLGKDDYKVDGDLVVFRVRSVPPFKDVRDLFPTQKTAAGFRGVGEYLLKDKSARDRTIEVRKITYLDQYIAALDSHCPGGVSNFVGIPFEDTVGGDCGSPLVTFSNFGPLILGIHELGQPGQSAALVVLQEQLMRLTPVEIISQGDPVLATQNSQQLELVDLHPKSPVRFIEDGEATVYGSFSGFRASPKSHVEKTLLCDYMLRSGYELKWGPPVMKGYRPWRRALLELTTNHHDFDNIAVDMCVTSLVEDWKGVHRKWKDEIMIYDNMTAANGRRGMRYIDGINRKTSAGFPWKQSKRNLLHHLEPTEEFDDPIEFDEEVIERVDKRLQDYDEGRRSYPVFVGTLKDEAISLKKIKQAKTRVFMVSSIDLTLTMRKLLLSFVRVVQKNKFIFEQAPGTEAQSVEWDFIRHYLTRFGEDRCVFGDFSGFDATMSSTFILAAFEAIALFHEHCGATEQHVRMIRALAYDVCFPVVDYNGDLVEFYGKNPSGQALTVIINGIVNCLYMRYVYLRANPAHEVRSFRKNITLMTYGDDNGMGVNRSIDWFDHTSIQAELATIGVTYTMADKLSETVPFIHIDDASFLKRRWLWFEETKSYVCPLEEDSIIKMLMIGNKSDFVSDGVKSCDNVHTALEEYFWYGREKFEERRSFLMKALVDCDLEKFNTREFKTFETLLVAYRSNSSDFLKEFKKDLVYYNELDFLGSQEYKLQNPAVEEV